MGVVKEGLSMCSIGCGKGERGGAEQMQDRVWLVEEVEGQMKKGTGHVQDRVYMVFI